MTQLDPQTRVADLVTQRPSLARLMEGLGIDYCCQGRQSLAIACAEKALDLDGVMAQIEQILEQPPEKNLESLSLTELADHIVACHHGFLRECLPLLSRQVDRVAMVHGPSHPELREVQRVFHEFSSEMLHHMQKEEQILFPAIRALDRELTTQIPLEHIIGKMEAEHEDSGAALSRLNSLTHGYVVPETACTTYRSMLQGLAELELDTHAHVHAENHILFARALKLSG